MENQQNSQARLDILMSLHFGKVDNPMPNASHAISTLRHHQDDGKKKSMDCELRGMNKATTPSMTSYATLPASVRMPLGRGWRPAGFGLSTGNKNAPVSSPGNKEGSNVDIMRSLVERYKLRIEDERSDRAKANVLAFERLYRKIFCVQHAVGKGEEKHNSSNGEVGGDMACNSREAEIMLAEQRVRCAALSHGFSRMAIAPTRNELEWAYDRRVDALGDRDNAYVTNSEIYHIVRYVCAPLTRETLFEHIDRLIRERYSMSYLFAYMKHLRRKYKRDFPLRGNERRAFTRSILQRYFDDYVPKRSTDEIYASDESTYARIKDWCLRYMFDDECTLRNSRNTRRATLRFVYTFLLMYYTGKRMSELCTLNIDNLARLHADRHIAIFIPKTRKLGRISYRTIDTTENAEFDAFLARSIYLFRDCLQSPYRESSVIPFDQFNYRKSLNRYFDRVYALVTAEKKPRGLSFHSLRRRKAAVSFERGVNLDNIREILDHSSTRVTNNYINKHLVRSYRSDKRSGTNNEGIPES